MHWVRPDRALAEGEQQRFLCRIRYRQPLQKARALMTANALYVIFDEPQRGITPGQFAALYDGDDVIGSGPIA